jgi:ABC-type glycerol-3-phosphate transport system permease component
VPAVRPVARYSVYSLLTIAVAASVAPLFWTLTASFKPQSEILSTSLVLIPQRLTMENYGLLLTDTWFARWFLNSLVVGIGTTLLALFFCTLAGFALAKYNFVGRRPIFYVIVTIVAVPQFVTVIPIFSLMAQLGLVNTYWALILPFAANPLGIFLVRQYMVSVPSELLEAARIDGCSEFGLFWRVVLPVARPVIGAVGIFVFVHTWNQYFFPLIMMTTPEMQMLPVGVASLSGFFFTRYGIIMAGAVLSVAPVMIVFFAMQKQFLAGLTEGSVKT